MSEDVIVIDAEPAEALATLQEALSAPDRAAGLRRVAGKWPAFLEAWACLADAAYEAGDEVASYAFARVGYHRGLDRLRAAGWRGSQRVPFERPENRGFLRALYALMRAAAAIGEGIEARRCREFLLQLDSQDSFRVGAIKPASLSRRLPS